MNLPRAAIFDNFYKYKAVICKATSVTGIFLVQFTCPIFGIPKSMSSSQFPSYKDVLLCCFQERMKLGIESGYSTVNFSDVSNIVAERVKSVYDKASVPTVQKKRILQLQMIKYLL